MLKKIMSAASESGYKLRTLYNKPGNLTISNAQAPFVNPKMYSISQHSSSKYECVGGKKNRKRILSNCNMKLFADDWYCI